MATPAVKNPAEEALGLLKGVQATVKDMDSRLKKQETLSESFAKAATTAASKAGYNPADYFAKMSDNGKLPVMLSGDGTVLPVNYNRARTKSIGRRKSESGHEAGFGEYLKHQWLFRQHGMGASQSVEALEKMGVYGVAESKDGTIRKTALAESSGVTGGYGVPPQFSNELLRIAVEKEIIANRAAKRPMTTRTLTLPSLDIATAYGAGTTPFLGGVLASWSQEAGLIPESEPKLRQTELTAWQLDFYLVYSNTLWQDEAVGLDSLVTSLMTDAIGFYRDLAYITGNGAGKPLGIQNAAAAIQVTRTSASHINWYDVGNMMRKTIYTDPGDMIWVAHPSCISDLIRMNDQSGGTTGIGTGRVLFQPYDQGAQAGIDRPAGPNSFGKLLGYDLYLSEKMANLGTLGDLMLVDPSKYLVGERADLQIDVSPHFLFTNNQTVLRVVYRGDGQPWLSSAITLQDGSYTVSPFIVLN